LSCYSVCSGREGKHISSTINHLARALWPLNIRERSSVNRSPTGPFTSRKHSRARWSPKGYCWPIDAGGNGRPYAAIPGSIENLTDNAWRTLADAFVARRSMIWTRYFKNSCGAITLAHS
jgi:hypothetical protein